MIAAVIPTRYHPPELGELLTVLDGDGIRAIVLESETFGHRIYVGWNEGVRQAREAGARHIAVLNDDIAIQPGTLARLASVLDANHSLGVVYPDVGASWGPLDDGYVQHERTQGTWGRRGMTGFCFMFPAHLDIPFDEGYGWWYGDDAFEQAVRDRDLGVARVLGVPILHRPDGSASKRWAELAPVIEQDRARWDALERERAYFAVAHAGRRE